MGKIADPSLAEKGRVAYNWALGNMRSLTTLIEGMRSEEPLKGWRIGVCLHVTKETSVLVMGLKELGAEVALAAANPLSTQDDIAAFLASQGIEVFAWRGEDPQEYDECLAQVLGFRPQLIMDDGSDLHVKAHTSGEWGIVGGTEETTTGVIRLRSLEREGRMRYPIIAVNNARSKFLFDNRYGTGQSTLDGLLRATSLLVAGKRLVVCGYGWVGRGIAMRARGMGAEVIVTEVDPFRALEARLDGFEVMPLLEASRLGDIFITATGQIGVIRLEHLRAMKPGAILANAGHFDVEIDVKALKEESIKVEEVRPHLERFELKDGKHLYLIGKGRVVNLVAAEGHPPEVMSLSFSNQLLSILHLSRHHEDMEKKLYSVPSEIDEKVARSALEALGVRIDEPTPEQLEYARKWLL